MARFKRQPGKSRRYLDTETGREVSRRQRDAIEEAAGRRQRMELARVTRNRVAARKFKELSHEYAELHGMSVREARNSDEFKTTIAGLESTNKRTKIRALKALGRREGIPDNVDPGKSPEFKKKGGFDIPLKERRSWWARVKHL